MSESVLERPSFNVSSIYHGIEVNPEIRFGNLCREARVTCRSFAAHIERLCVVEAVVPYYVAMRSIIFGMPGPRSVSDVKSYLEQDRDERLASLRLLLSLIARYGSHRGLCPEGFVLCGQRFQYNGKLYCPVFNKVKNDARYRFELTALPIEVALYRRWVPTVLCREPVFAAA